MGPLEAAARSCKGRGRLVHGPGRLWPCPRRPGCGRGHRDARNVTVRPRTTRLSYESRDTPRLMGRKLNHGFSFRPINLAGARKGDERGEPVDSRRKPHVPGVSWWPGQAARLPRDARDVREIQGRSRGRHDLRSSVTGRRRRSQILMRLATLPDGSRGGVRRLSPIRLQATNGRWRRPDKTGGSVTFHGSSSRTLRFRDRSRAPSRGTGSSLPPLPHSRRSRPRPRPARAVAEMAGSLSPPGATFKRPIPGPEAVE
jgi:hypothetical protein